MAEGPGFIVVVPTLIVFVLAVWTRRPIESLLAGSVVGLIITQGSGFVTGFAETSIRVLMDEDVAWVILVCGFMGSLIAILIRTGATAAFTDWMSRRVRSAKGALFVTWLIGLTMFVDDYLNSLAVGSAMRNLTDRYRISREKLAYVVDSTAAPVSVLIPMSTWVVFFGALLEANGVADDGRGVATYIGAIPYMFYAWIAVLLVPVVIAGRIGDLGGMRAAERRAAGGVTVPPEAEHVEAANRAVGAREGATAGPATFVVPMLALVGFTIWFEIDFLRGIYVTLALTLAGVMGLRMLGMHEAFDTVIDGFKTMIEPLAVLVAAFMLKEVNEELGLSAYVIEMIEPLLTAESLPAVIFATMGLVSFATGSNWGVFVIILPIVVALADSLGANMTWVIGATLSASTFGSHACFYSDATVLTAQATGCTPLAHALTQIPYALIAAAIALGAYLALGYL